MGAAALVQKDRRTSHIFYSILLQQLTDHGYRLRDARYARTLRRYVPLRFVTLIYDFVTLVTLRYVTSRYVTKYSIFC